MHTEKIRAYDILDRHTELTALVRACLAEPTLDQDVGQAAMIFRFSDDDSGPDDPWLVRRLLPRARLARGARRVHDRRG